MYSTVSNFAQGSVPLLCSQLILKCCAFRVKRVNDLHVNAWQQT